MNIRGFLSRALIALSIALGAAGASQAQPSWQAVGGENSMVTMEISANVVQEVAASGFWQRFLAKSSWARLGVRVGNMCAIGTVTALAVDSATTQATWFMKGISAATGCGIGATAGAFAEFAYSTLLAAEFSQLVALGGALWATAFVAISAKIAIDLAWQASTLGNGMARKSQDGTYVTVPRRALKIYKDEYIDHTNASKLKTNLKHPEARYANSSTFQLRDQIGTQDVGGQRVYINDCGKWCY